MPARRERCSRRSGTAQQHICCLNLQPLMGAIIRLCSYSSGLPYEVTPPGKGVVVLSALCILKAVTEDLMFGVLYIEQCEVARPDYLTPTGCPLTGLPRGVNAGCQTFNH